MFCAAPPPSGVTVATGSGVSPLVFDWPSASTWCTVPATGACTSSRLVHALATQVVSWTSCTPLTTRLAGIVIDGVVAHWPRPRVADDTNQKVPEAALGHDSVTGWLAAEKRRNAPEIWEGSTTYVTTVPAQIGADPAAA